jgi:hypothetical protein
LIEIDYNVTELNERHAIYNIQNLLGKKLRFAKIPGPFRDQHEPVTQPDRPDLVEKKVQRLQQLTEQAKEKQQQYQQHQQQQHQQRYQQNDRDVAREQRQPYHSRQQQQQQQQQQQWRSKQRPSFVNTEELKRRSLRTFEQGKFENIIQGREEHKAISKGAVEKLAIRKRGKVKQIVKWKQ